MTIALGHQHVGRFDVPVNDPGLVRRRERVGELDRVFDGFGDGERTAAIRFLSVSPW
jgi:hypothetical protein